MITPDQLAAYADGELSEFDMARVRCAVDADPALARQLADLSGLRTALRARFDPVLAEPVPERLTAPLHAAGKIVRLGDVRAARRRPVWQRPALRYGGGLAIAASLVFAVLIGLRTPLPAGYAGGELAAALDEAASGQSAAGGTRVLISFRNAGGQVCRGYSGERSSGIACHDPAGWKVQPIGPGSSGDASPVQAGQYRQAGSTDSAVMAAVQDMAAGPALDAAAEQTARADGWR